MWGKNEIFCNLKKQVQAEKNRRFNWKAGFKLTALSLIFILVTELAVQPDLSSFGYKKVYAETITDTEAPTAPANLNISGSADAIVLSWDASSDDVGVAGYKIYRNAVEIGTATETSYTDDTITEPGTYTYTVKAYDTTGNLSLPSAGLILTISAGDGSETPENNEIPTAPTNLSVSGSADAIVLSWDASSDDIGVTGYKIYRNGEEIGTTTEITYTDDTITEPGSYLYTVKAYDESGNLSEASAGITVTISTGEEPDDPGNNEIPTAPTNLSISGSALSIILSWDASTDDGGVAGYKIYRDGVEIGTSTETIYTDDTITQAGTYLYTVKAYDADGNLSKPSNGFYLTIGDNQAPTVPQNVTAIIGEGPSVILSWDASLDYFKVEGYKIYKDGVEIATTTETTYTDTSVKMGDVYNYTVKAYDASDNLSDPSDIVTIDYNDTVDTDGDGLVDYLENMIGTNIIKADTDGDGLTDRYEHIILGTNPLLLDTDEDGISDADEDADEDGLTNKDEATYGTDPLYEDTDGDGLTDSDEVNVYFTNPLLSDTDGEGLSDDDEITLGFNPLNPDTDNNGITDANEKVNQTLNVSIEEDEKPGITGASVTMNGTGNIKNNTTIDNIFGIDTLSSDVVGLIGVPVEITSNSQFDEATITFHYDDRFLGDTKEEDLAVMWYDEENNAYQILDADTVIDTANNTVSYTTTHFSTYMVVDRQKWYDVWSNAITYRRDPEVPGIPVEYFDISFAVDKSGSMSGSNIETAKEAISSFIDALYSNDRGSIVAFDSGAIVSADFTSDKTILKNALNSIKASGGTSVNAGLLKAISLYDGSASSNSKMIILLCDGDVNCTQDTIQKAIDSNIKIYPVLIGSTSSSSALESIASQTGGTFYYAATAEDIRKAIYGIQEGAMLDTTDTDGDGLYDIYETAGMMLPNGQIVYSDPLKKDTDSDKLSDFLEMGGIEEFDNENLIKQYIMTKEGYDNTIYATYFNYVSNPNLSDTDNDGVNDYDDAYGTDSTKSMDDDELTGTYQYFIDLANENYENRSYIYDGWHWDDELQNNITETIREIPVDLTSDERSIIIDGIIIFEASKLQDKYRTAYTASDNIISKYITERGFHQHLVPLYTQYPDMNDPTIKNEYVRAFLDGFCIGFYQGIIYGSMDWMATYKYEDSMAYARRIGRQGEKASGIIKNHKHITSKTRSAEYRIPDGLDEVNGILSEVKNVKQLGYTKQLEDFYEYCQDNYYTFELYVRTTTKLSSKLRKLIEAGKITLKYLP